MTGPVAPPPGQDPRRGWNLVGGALRPGFEGYEIDVHDPSSGAIVAQVARASRRDVEDALAAATAAGAAWQAAGWGRRTAWLEAARAALGRHGDELLRLDALDAGVPLPWARQRLRRLLAALERLTGEARELARIELEAERTGLARGLALGRLAWLSGGSHGPAAVAAVAAALLAGNTVVWKPSSRAPLLPARAATLLAEALPAGALNLLHGTGETTGARLACAAAVDALGGHSAEPTARALGRTAAGDGRTAMLVTPRPLLRVAEPPAALSAAIERTVARLGVHAGQDGPPELLAVPRDLLAAALAELEARLVGLCTGQALDASTRLGPMLDEQSADRVVRWADGLADRGGNLRLRPRRLSLTGCGYHLLPALVEEEAGVELAPSAPFGPTVLVRGYAGEDELRALLGRRGQRVELWATAERAEPMLAACAGAAVAIAPARDPAAEVPLRRYRRALWIERPGREPVFDRQGESRATRETTPAAGPGAGAERAQHTGGGA